MITQDHKPWILILTRYSTLLLNLQRHISCNKCENNEQFNRVILLHLQKYNRHFIIGIYDETSQICRSASYIDQSQKSFK